jgi:hypothetical protein
MNFDEFRQLADQVRALPLEAVLRARHAVRDRRDKRKWHTDQGPLSITGARFMNWQQGVGGGGAIDLVLHLGERDFRAAVLWLARNVAGIVTTDLLHTPRSASTPAGPKRPLRLPVRHNGTLSRVIGYLAHQRGLPSALVNLLIDEGRLYADERGNAVFLMLAGKPHRVVGAELRGTGGQSWRGMAPGSTKDAGFFWIGDAASQRIVLCESAIDAISCHALDRERICISTSGVRSNPRWLPALIARGYTIACGFDADQAGDNAAKAMIPRYPLIERLRPPAKDWNDVLLAHNARSNTTQNHHLPPSPSQFLSKPKGHGT